MASPRHVRRPMPVKRAACACACAMEPLDGRRLMSGYAVVDVSWVPGRDLSPGRMTNGGLFSVAAGSDLILATLSRRRAYATPYDFNQSNVNAAGILIGSSRNTGKAELDVNGSRTELPAAAGIGAIIGAGSGSASNWVTPWISDSGWAVGTIQCNTPGVISSSWFSVIAEYDPVTKQSTAISAIGEGPRVTRACVNDAGVIAYGAQAGNESPSIYDPATGQVTAIAGTDARSAVTWINDHNQVIGSNFLYDAQTQTLLKFGSSRTAKGFTPASIDDAGVIVGAAQFRARVRNHFAWVQHGAVFADGKLTDLNALVHADEIITGASSINNAGQILASTARGGVAGVCVMSPS